jgi:GrpB-like predicted nucleotidyltransferase (UPF0157 family)
MIEIVAYDIAWPASFAEEAAAIRCALGADALRIEHVGSTAVEGLSAKPVIDIQVSVQTLDEPHRFLAPLSGLGYVHVPLGAFDQVYPFFQKPATWPSTHHVHLCAAGSGEERNHLLFRDALRAHPNIAEAYVALKRELASRHRGTTLQSREAYSLSKTAFVKGVLERAWLDQPRGT